MRTNVWFYGTALLLLFVTSATQAQNRTNERSASSVATATPLVRVTTQNPREINLGKPATFVIAVSNEGKTAATGVIVSTSIPEHVELTKWEPKPIQVEGRIYKFQIGDLAPGTKRRVTLVAVPRTIDPVRLDTTVIFATSTRSSVLVRRPQLQVTAQVPPQVVIGERVDWTVRVTNIGDGPADNVILTPSLVEGEFQGSSMQQTVQVGLMKPGETKAYKFSGVGARRGKVTGRFVGSNPDGLEVAEDSTFQVLQAELSVKVVGPQVLPMGRDGTYEIRVTNPGDATTGSTLVTVKMPSGLEVNSAPENAYREDTRTLRWRITGVRPSDIVPLRFRAETTVEGDQTLNVIAQSERISAATTTHTTNVMSRPNLIVTVVNSQELSAIGDPISFQVNVVNSGSKPAEDLRVRVSMPDGFEAVASGDYQVTAGQIEFPLRKLASGEKTSLSFRAIGRRVGDHRVRVLVDGAALTDELAFEVAAFCYAETEDPAGRTAQGESPRRAPAPLVLPR